MKLLTMSGEISEPCRPDMSSQMWMCEMCTCGATCSQSESHKVVRCSIMSRIMSGSV